MNLFSNRELPGSLILVSHWQPLSLSCGPWLKDHYAAEVSVAPSPPKGIIIPEQSIWKNTSNWLLLLHQVKDAKSHPCHKQTQWCGLVKIHCAIAMSFTME